MSWYDRHIRQSPFTAHCTVVALLAVTDWILDECVSQSQPLHWLVRFPQEFEFGVIEIRVSIKAVGMRQPLWVTCKLMRK